jgi:xylulokinase
MRVLALDVGSTSVKAAVVADGSVTVSGAAEHPTHRSRPGWVEQDPVDWWSGTARAIASCRAEARSVDAIAVTGQMQDLILVDAEGRSIGPALLYSDARAVAEHAELLAALGDAWAATIGSRPDATNVAAKWRWLTRHEPARTGDARRVLFGSHSVVVANMTGRMACDPTTAATTGLLDLAVGSWAAPVLEACGLPGGLMPEVVAATHLVGNLGAPAAAQLGLTAGIPVVHAAGDAVATTLGIVGAEQRAPYAYLGTTGWVAVVTDELPRTDGVIALPAIDGAWLAVAPILSAGATIDWARTTLLGGVSYDELDRLASSACGAAVGLVLLPHLAGSRGPFADPHAAGALVGLRASTTAAEIAASVHEGVAHALRQIADVLGVRGRTMAVCGGAVASDSLCATLADVLDTEVRRADDANATLLGAAACARIALGEAVGAARGSAAERGFVPATGRVELHRRLAPTIDALAPALSPAFAALDSARIEQLPDAPHC